MVPPIIGVALLKIVLKKNVLRSNYFYARRRLVAEAICLHDSVFNFGEQVRTAPVENVDGCPIRLASHETLKVRGWT